MRVCCIGFKNFRNLKESNINTDSDIVILEGMNGMGKTSFLESLYSCLLMSSFRTKKIEELISYGSEKADVSVTLRESGMLYSVLSSIGKSEKLVVVKGNIIKKHADLFRLFPAVVFTYDDKNLVMGEPSFRRRFLNRFICFINPDFVIQLKSYERYIRDRNQALRTSHLMLLDVYDREISRLGFNIYNERKKLCKLVENQLNLVFLELFGRSSNFRIQYKSSCDKTESADEYLKKLKNNLSRDLARGITSFGPHSDDFIFMHDNKILRPSSSTGQIRLFSIMLRLSEIMIIYEKNGVSPIILVDDALLEMDRERKKAVFNYLSHFEQVFYTFMPDEDFYIGDASSGMDIRKLKVENGAVYE